EHTRLLYKARRLHWLAQLLGRKLGGGKEEEEKEKETGPRPGVDNLDALQIDALRKMVIDLEQALLPKEDWSEDADLVSAFDFGWNGVLDFVRHPMIDDHEVAIVLEERNEENVPPASSMVYEPWSGKQPEEGTEEWWQEQQRNLPADEKGKE